MNSANPNNAATKAPHMINFISLPRKNRDRHLFLISPRQKSSEEKTGQTHLIPAFPTGRYEIKCVCPNFFIPNVSVPIFLYPLPRDGERGLSRRHRDSPLSRRLRATLSPGRGCILSAPACGGKWPGAALRDEGGARLRRAWIEPGACTAAHCATPLRLAGSAPPPRAGGGKLIPTLKTCDRLVSTSGKRGTSSVPCARRFAEPVRARG